MKVYLNEISGLWQAIVSMYLSKRTWTREKEQRIMEIYDRNFDRHGKLIREEPDEEMKKLLIPLFKWAPLHITMCKFIDFRFTVEGLHRGAQDDFDSHAKRFDNRIIRSSTRLANYGVEKSDWYHGKIITTDEMLSHLKIDLPKEVEGKDGTKYVRVANGYVKEADAGNHDVTRGLLMLSIPLTSHSLATVQSSHTSLKSAIRTPMPRRNSGTASKRCSSRFTNGFPAAPAISSIQ